MSRTLSKIAKTIRSKNAGVDKITFDVIFPDRATYDLVRESGVLSREAMSRARGRLLSAGQALKAALGIAFVLIGAAIVTGVDKRIETALVDASPQWLTDLTTRY